MEPPPIVDKGVITDEALAEEKLSELEQLPEYPPDPKERFGKRKSH